MIVESHDRLRAPDVRRATRTLVRDDQNNPVAVFIQVSPGHLFMSVRGEANFEQALASLGVRDTVLTHVLQARDLPEIRAE